MKAFDVAFGCARCAVRHLHPQLPKSTTQNATFKARSQASALKTTCVTPAPLAAVMLLDPLHFADRKEIG